MNRKPLRLSSLNNFPASYMLIGMWFSFEPNLIVTNRQTYDLLNFLGDIGGLDGTLSTIGYLLVSSYNNLNAYAILISLLFRKSG
jgi:hypothetical protein